MKEVKSVTGASRRVGSKRNKDVKDVIYFKATFSSSAHIYNKQEGRLEEYCLFFFDITFVILSLMLSKS